MSESEPNQSIPVKSGESLLQRFGRILRRLTQGTSVQPASERELVATPAGPDVAQYDPPQVLVTAFIGLRRSGLSLGVEDLLDALRAVEGGWGVKDPADLNRMVRLLWCKSLDEERELELVWDAALAANRAGMPSKPLSHRQAASEESRPTPQPESKQPRDVPRTTPEVEGHTPGSEWGALPVKTVYTPALVEDASELRAYYPVSRRFMVYGWRYLRRTRPDGPEDVLDLQSTIERVARQGFFLKPVFRRRERNHAHLVLLLDQGGSMAPFHRFTRDMEETARHDSTIEQVDVFYFHNTPAEQMYLDPPLTHPASTAQLLSQVTSDSSVLIVSDAGAARGYRHLDRIRATTHFLAQLKRRSSLIAWLNPMPSDRWHSTSAQVISYQVPMFQMDPDGLSNAIDTVRGQPLLRLQ